MRHFRLQVEYDGARFEGWQIQAGDSRTVQGCIIAACETIGGKGVRVAGSGRTDSGVHAHGQVVAVALETSLSAAELQRALNGNLPLDVAVLTAEETSPEFDPRRQAKDKLYRYAVWNGSVRSPLRDARWVHVRQALDLAAMREAAGALLGVHDFACFQAAGSEVEHTVREIFRVDVLGDAGGEITFEVEGSGFLRHMVRNIAGTLIEVGRGKREPGSMAALIEGRDRGKAGPTAPAKGLYLVSVQYVPSAGG
ncbi:MAG: tRNA pseudouridine38-40 synthase [Myxococcota bacterium]|jgi:tRNA pseudouridine38-40 synthase